MLKTRVLFQQVWLHISATNVFHPAMAGPTSDWTHVAMGAEHAYKPTLSAFAVQHIRQTMEETPDF
jgi:hypothetical protein